MRFPSPALAGALALPGLTFFFGVSAALQFLRDDYDWIATPLSFYLLGTYSGWLISAYFLLAASIALIGIGLHAALPASGRLPLMLFGTGALAICIVALAHTDLPGGPAPTGRGLAHNLAAALAFLSVSLAMLLQAWRFRHAPPWRRHFPAAFILALVIFAALLTYTLWPALPRGVTQKAVILLIVLWLLLVARWLMQTRAAPAEAN